MDAQPPNDGGSGGNDPYQGKQLNQPAAAAQQTTDEVQDVFSTTPAGTMMIFALVMMGLMSGVLSNGTQAAPLFYGHGPAP